MQLVSCHQDLASLFERHMEALLLLDLRKAAHLLGRFQHELLSHMNAEEEVMLPLYGVRAGDVLGGGVELYQSEHKKMRDLVAGFVAAVKRLQPEPRDVLELLEQEFAFKQLMQQHDKRETSLLYRWMDRITSKDERTALLRRLDDLDGRGAHVVSDS